MQMDGDKRAAKFTTWAVILMSVAVLVGISGSLAASGAYGSADQGGGALGPIAVLAVIVFFLLRRANQLKAPGKFVRDFDTQFNVNSSSSMEEHYQKVRGLLDRGLKITQAALSPFDTIVVAGHVVALWQDLPDELTSSGNASREAAEFGATYLPFVAPAARDTRGNLTDLAVASCMLLSCVAQCHLDLGEFSIARAIAERAPLDMQDLSDENLWQCLAVRTMAYAGLGYREQAERDYSRLYAAKPGDPTLSEIYQSLWGAPA